MKVINSHKRIINQPKEVVSELLQTLSTNDDKIWAYEKWPAIRFREGLKIGSSGGHGIIRYTISDYKKDNYIVFTFTKPNGFNGVHRFDIKALSANKSEISHLIDMKLTGFSLITWPLVIRWLHDALIEDVLDKYQNNFLKQNVRSSWSFWVKLWRLILR